VPSASCSTRTYAFFHDATFDAVRPLMNIVSAQLLLELFKLYNMYLYLGCYQVQTLCHGVGLGRFGTSTNVTCPAPEPKMQFWCIHRHLRTNRTDSLHKSVMHVAVRQLPLVAGTVGAFTLHFFPSACQLSNRVLIIYKSHVCSSSRWTCFSESTQVTRVKYKISFEKEQREPNSHTEPNAFCWDATDRRF
jgi:hypothetical protein